MMTVADGAVDDSIRVRRSSMAASWSLRLTTSGSGPPATEPATTDNNPYNMQACQARNLVFMWNYDCYSESIFEITLGIRVRRQARRRPDVQAQFALTSIGGLFLREQAAFPLHR